MDDIGRAALAARVFTIAALASLAALGGTSSLESTLLVVLVACGALVLSLTGRVSQTAVAMIEGSVIAALAVLTFPYQATVTPYLVIPALIASLDGGRRALFRVITVEFGVLVAVWFLVEQQWNREMAASVFTWLATAIGLGLMGATLRNAVTNSETDTSYRSAVALIRRLQALSGKLSGGLDQVDIAEQLMDEADEVLPIRHAGVFVPTPDGGVVPVRYSMGAGPSVMGWAGPLAEACLHAQASVSRDHQAALPLLVDDDLVAVLVLEALGPVDDRAAEALTKRLAPQALQLQAALLFGQVRATATSQERQRIAREVHDGVAQDVASLGYLVDNLGAGAEHPEQQERIAQLRGEVSRVVSDLRHSIFDLRQVAPTGAGLGESLTAYARQVGSTSPLTVHVTLDEEGQRLHSEVEHELLRIAQEAMSNARKHSGAENLWLRCTVRAPYAEIEVGDDGTNGHAPAPDSQGMKIMRERAELVGAELDVEAPQPGRPGTRVRVRIGAPTG